MKIYAFLFIGFILFFMNWWLLDIPLPVETTTGFYIFSMAVGYICLLMGGLWMSRLLKNNLMDDVFNTENESFMQETRLLQSEYSVEFCLQNSGIIKRNGGMDKRCKSLSCQYCIRHSGSGKSYAVVNQYIKQQIEKGFRCISMILNFLTYLQLLIIIC